MSRVKKVSFAAIFVALSVVFSFLTVSILPTFQVGVTEFPIMGSGFVLGPFFGSLVGLVKDVFTMISKGYPPSLFTLSPILLGLIPGLFTVIVGKKRVYNSFWLLLVIVYITTLARSVNDSMSLHFVYGLEWNAVIAMLPAKMLLVVVEGVIYALLFKLTLPIIDRQFFKD